PTAPGASRPAVGHPRRALRSPPHAAPAGSGCPPAVWPRGRRWAGRRTPAPPRHSVRHRLVEGREHGVAEAVEREASPQALERRRAERTASGSVTEQPDDRLGQRRRVSGRAEQPTLTVDGQLRGAPDRRGAGPPPPG